MRLFMLETDVTTLYYALCDGRLLDSDTFGARVGESLFIPRQSTLSHLVEVDSEIDVQVFGILDRPDNQKKYEAALNEDK